MKKVTPPERHKVPYPFIVCKIKGCVKIHHTNYPLCNEHRKEDRKD